MTAAPGCSTPISRLRRSSQSARGRPRVCRGHVATRLPRIDAMANWGGRGLPHRFDAIIIGGAHNGLVTAAYLARAGLQTLVLERRPVLGGACVTEEPWAGYKVSTLAYLCSLFQTRIVRELQLGRFGYVLYPKDTAFFTAFPDGRHLFFWRDQHRTVTALQQFSTRDAAMYPQYEAQLARLGAFVETLLLQTPPNIVARRPTDLLALARLGLRLLRLH